MPIDIHQDLHDARTLLEQSGNEDEKRKYRKAAELILLKAVHLEPENEEAKILLQSARAVPFGFSSRPPQLFRAQEPLRAEQPIRLIEPSRMPEPVNTPELQMDEEVPFVAAPVFKSVEPGRNKSGLKLPLGLIATVLIGAGALWMLQSRPGNRTTIGCTCRTKPTERRCASTSLSRKSDTRAAGGCQDTACRFAAEQWSPDICSKFAVCRQRSTPCIVPCASTCASRIRGSDGQSRGEFRRGGRNLSERPVPGVDSNNAATTCRTTNVGISPWCAPHSRHARYQEQPDFGRLNHVSTNRSD